LGGTPGFYGEDSIFISWPYVFAVADDGHISAHLILTFAIEEDDTVTWRLIAYDVGQQGFVWQSR
jgi:hypothetical protein